MYHEKSFLLPAILAGGRNMEEQIAIHGGATMNTEESQSGVSVNCVLHIEMNGPLLESKAGLLFMPPYQAFSLHSIEVNNNVLVVHLQGEVALKTISAPFSEKEMEIIIKKGDMPRNRNIAARTLLFHVNGLKTSFARLAK